MVPGIKAVHAIITPTCRENRGVEGALEEALRRVREEYLACQGEQNQAASFHVVLTVERPVEQPKSASKWKPLLPNTRYEKGDIVRTSDNPLKLTLWKVLIAGITDDLEQFRAWQHIIEANRPLHLHETWDYNGIRFGLPRRDECE